MTVVLASRLPLRATIVAVPLLRGTTRPLGETEATSGLRQTQLTACVQSWTLASADRALAMSCAVARRPSKRDSPGVIVSVSPWPAVTWRCSPAFTGSVVKYQEARSDANDNNAMSRRVNRASISRPSEDGERGGRYGGRLRRF